MSVLLPDRQLGVRRREAPAVDAHGDAVGGGWGGLLGPWPGRAEESGDVPAGLPGGRTWVLALDPAAWPVHQNDLVEDPRARMQWLVTSADLLKHNADPAIDYIRVEAHLRDAGTRP
ncbi:hypothetical protein ACFY05_32235 [Microtetraspora fusca]|uniref:Uncharacterized protein n=1 Tax=Microtetraspora fusca TaxID=1997 RepID=A0ABW6VE02_MICFU